MKKVFLGINFMLIAVGISIAGPADKMIDVRVGGGAHSTGSKYDISSTKIENKSEIQGSKLTNLGIDQKNTINSIKIRKDVKIEKSVIKNKAKITGSQITNVGIGQDTNVGSVDLGDNPTQ